MKRAYDLALDAYRMDEVPVGAFIISRESAEIVASAHNEVEMRKNPAAHAEMLVIERACKAIGSKSLAGHDLYVTLEPCPMCAAAISFARIDRLYFGAYDLKSGGVENGPMIFNSPNCHHKPEIYGGIMERECSELLKRFFANKRR